MIEVRGLTKRYGATTAVSGLTFTVQPGHVTGLLGPNGSGKSTTMRLILGLDLPTAGTALVGGRQYRSLRLPMTHVGALLDARSGQGGRRARSHLLALARASQVRAARVDELLELVGLSSVADRRIGGFSLGMSQRLAIAAALLGDPPILLLDEPINGLDTTGIRWIRGLLRSLAAEGRTVLVSSHVMSEMQLTADHLVILGAGRLVAEAPMAELVARHGTTCTLVESPDPAALLAMVRGAGGAAQTDPSGGLLVIGLDAASIGELAHASSVRLHRLAPLERSLEDVYSELVAGSAEFTARDEHAAGEAGGPL